MTGFFIYLYFSLSFAQKSLSILLVYLPHKSLHHGFNQLSALISPRAQSPTGHTNIPDLLHPLRLWCPDSAGNLPPNLSRRMLSDADALCSREQSTGTHSFPPLSLLLAKARASTSGQDPAPPTFSQNLNHQLTLISPETQALPSLGYLPLTTKHSKHLKNFPSFGVLISLSYGAGPCVS